MNGMAKRVFTLVLLTLGSALSLVLLYLASRSNYLLFHVCVESYAIVVGFCVSVVAINQQTQDQDGSFTFMGVAFATVGVLTILHMASYKGMGVFQACQRTWQHNSGWRRGICMRSLCSFHWHLLAELQEAIACARTVL